MEKSQPSPHMSPCGSRGLTKILIGLFLDSLALSLVGIAEFPREEIFLFLMFGLSLIFIFKGLFELVEGSYTLIIVVIGMVWFILLALIFLGVLNF